MSFDRNAIDELLGAWALDALDAETAVAVEAALAADPTLAEGARALRHAAGTLAGEVEARPPADAGVDRLLAAALRKRRPGRDVAVPEPASALEVLRDRLAATLAAAEGVADDQWDRPAVPYPWTLHGLVAHLLGLERYLARLLGVPGVEGSEIVAEPEHDHLAMTDTLIAATAGDRPAATIAAWREASARVVEHLAGPDAPALDARVSFHGFPLSVGSLLIVRGFELWTHAADIRRATGQPPVPTPPAVLHTMADLSVRSLALLGAGAGGGRPVRAHVVLTGDGGGTWTLDVDADAGGTAAETREVEVVAEIGAYCSMASGRLAPELLDAVVRGDVAVGAHLMRSSQAFAL